MVKLSFSILLCIEAILSMLLGSFTSNAQKQVSADPSDEAKFRTMAVQLMETAQPAVSEFYLDDTVYLGKYLDSDCEEPNLAIAKEADGKYLVQIGIYRLTSLPDGIGELTVDGMKFTATDASGNPICGIITVKEQTATVTFTDSTWEYLQNGSSFQYTKSSAIPAIWSESY